MKRPPRSRRGRSRLLSLGAAAGGTALLLALHACAPTATQSDLPPGVSFMEEVQRQPGDEVTIPFRRFELDNGLTVILHQDTSDPLVHVDVTYHVGSGREDIGKSGFAHFFEHMMFQGSENVGDDQHFKIVSEAGGTLNGTTNSDRTNYFQTAPSNQLEKMLWLEADRMGFLLDAVTQEKFEVQRDVVKNERGQRVDNQPYGLLFERIGEAMYPEGHPYSWSTIGYMEDLDRVDVNDLKQFFLRWYGPNNAAIAIGGDFDEAQTLEWVAKYFGPIPRGPEVGDVDKAPVTLDANRYISLEDNVPQALLFMAFPTVHANHADEAPLDVLDAILGDGETSLLYKNMVKNRLATTAGANHGCREISCTFTISALANQTAGTTLADLEKIARDTFAEFEQRGVTDDDLLRLKSRIVAGMIYGLESTSGKVSRLARYQYLTGNPDYAAKDLARYENVTKEDVMRVYDKYIKGRNAVVMSIVPHGQPELRAAEDTWQRYQRTLPEYAPTDESDIAYRRATDTFDRSIMPPPGDNPAITLPDIWRSELDNGIEVLGARNTETPTTAITLRIEAGQREESLDQLGLASLTAAMMNESTELSTNEQLSDRLQKLGSGIGFNAGNNATLVTVRTLTRNLDETLAILEEKLLKPKFDAADFARVQAQTLQGIEQSKKQPAATAATVYQLLLLGRDNSIAYPNAGTTETVSALTVEDARAFYDAHYSPRIASIVAVSDLDQAALLPKLAALQAWQGPEVERAPLNPFPDNGKTKLYLVHKPDAPQSVIRIGKHALPYDATGEYYRAGLANYVLGGSFNSRINMNLREDKSYTYGARAGFAGNKEYGTFNAQSQVRGDATAASIIEFENEIRRYAEDGMTADELAFTRSAIGQRDALRYETPGQKAGLLGTIQLYGLQDNYVEEQNRILANISAEELHAIAKKHLVMDEMVIVVVGDRIRLESELAELGYEIVHLDANGLPVEPVAKEIADAQGT